MRTSSVRRRTQHKAKYSFKDPANIATIDLDESGESAKHFFDSYVATRTPVLIRGMLPELEPLIDRWLAGELQRVAGNSHVQVEVRKSPTEPFGQGNRIIMRFGSLLDEIANGNTRYYMTTQDLPQLTGGGEALLAPPLSLMRDELPLRPSLLPTLYPQSANLWIGRTEDGVSSGLHHDHHDNLYCLLRGRKRLQIYSPRDAYRLYTHGRITRVHSNGRINYAGEPTFADGRTPLDASEHKMRRSRACVRRAERELERAEAEDGVDKTRATERAVEEAENALEAALDRAANAEMLRSRLAANRHRAAAASSSAPPPNFSRIPPAASAAELRHFPLVQRVRGTACNVKGGEMLYLPCGWFHEVTSYGEHIALNYWFHPPDRSTFEKPYTHASFWENEWRRQSHSL
eukprot:CAMPEP_0119317842 /NCGR_PEP_ID=MMETSP1333-20130426/44514_1 /TAXON_ID=418940 /ORGANISM="Scyphosphaera apsteinii, Strain RCC1455" /LENGTH=403 /DNA_ID=CAMNT_0007323901 /DNA_START=189 /DNA_END=1400 /DNA_ORIENTATION=-